MKKTIITTISFVFMAVMSFSQNVIETYDVTKDKQTTVIVKDKSKSDKDILNELDLDDYTVGEEVYITAEMWEKIQKEQESKKNTSDKEDLALVEAAPAKVEKEKEVKVEEKEVKADEKPAKKTTTKEKTSSTTTKKKVAKKKKSKKVKKYRYKKPKRKKRRRLTRRSSRTTCYSF